MSMKKSEACGGERGALHDPVVVTMVECKDIQQRLILRWVATFVR